MTIFIIFVRIAGFFRACIRICHFLANFANLSFGRIYLSFCKILCSESEFAFAFLSEFRLIFTKIGLSYGKKLSFARKSWVFFDLSFAFFAQKKSLVYRIFSISTVWSLLDDESFIDNPLIWALTARTFFSSWTIKPIPDTWYDG